MTEPPAPSSGSMDSGLSLADAETTVRAVRPVEEARDDFPPLQREIRPGVPLVYLDSAATSLKPRAVIEAVEGYLAEYPANVHRGLHALSERATEAYESARETVARFVGAAESAEIVFTRGTTEAVNLVAHGWGRTILKPGDEIVLTLLEHHSNWVPWQMTARATGAVLKFVDITDDGHLDLDAYHRLLESGRVKLVAVTGMSNVLGTIPPVKAMIASAHAHGALALVDGAQSMPHLETSVARLDADFLAFSAHKMGGPTGVGALYGRRALLEAMEPMLGGGSMIGRVTTTDVTWNEIPWKFEAGTPPIAEVIGFAAAIEYLGQFDLNELLAHERWLTAEAHRVLGEVGGVRILGPGPAEKGGIVSFTVEGVHPHDLAQLVDRDGVAIRAGHHCAMPLHERLGLTASARASLYLYNNVDDVRALAVSIDRARRLFTRG